MPGRATFLLSTVVECLLFFAPWIVTAAALSDRLRRLSERSPTHLRRRRGRL